MRLESRICDSSEHQAGNSPAHSLEVLDSNTVRALLRTPQSRALQEGFVEHRQPSG